MTDVGDQHRFASIIGEPAAPWPLQSTPLPPRLPPSPRPDLAHAASQWFRCLTCLLGQTPTGAGRLQMLPRTPASGRGVVGSGSGGRVADVHICACACKPGHAVRRAICHSGPRFDALSWRPAYPATGTEPRRPIACIPFPLPTPFPTPTIVPSVPRRAPRPPLATSLACARSIPRPSDLSPAAEWRNQPKLTLRPPSPLGSAAVSQVTGRPSSSLDT